MFEFFALTRGHLPVKRARKETEPMAIKDLKPTPSNQPLHLQTNTFKPTPSNQTQAFSPARLQTNRQRSVSSRPGSSPRPGEAQRVDPHLHGLLPSRPRGQRRNETGTRTSWEAHVDTRADGFWTTEFIYIYTHQCKKRLMWDKGHIPVACCNGGINTYSQACLLKLELLFSLDFTLQSMLPWNRSNGAYGTPASPQGKSSVVSGRFGRCGVRLVTGGGRHVWVIPGIDVLPKDLTGSRHRSVHVQELSCSVTLERKGSFFFCENHF